MVRGQVDGDVVIWDAATCCAPCVKVDSNSDGNAPLTNHTFDPSSPAASRGRAEAVVARGSIPHC
eukprot:540470-Amphidinium_carterae.1